MKGFLSVLLLVILVLGGLVGCTRAEFELSQLTITPSQVVSGETFTVSAEIKNVGSADGVYTARLTVNGTEVAAKDIAIASGTTEKVSFTLAEGTPGSYNIMLDDMTASFTVLKVPSVEEIIDSVVQSLYEVNTYQFDLDMTIDMEGEAEGEAFELTMSIDSSGACNTGNRLMRIELILRVETPEEEEAEVGMEVYLIGNTEYTYMEIPETEPMWTKSRMPVGTWKEMTQVEPQIELLKLSTVELVGSEKVRGEDCYVLQLTPDVEQFWQIAMQQMGTSGAGVPEIPGELIEEILQSISMKQWIEKDTYFLAKAEAAMTMEITPEVMGSPEEEGVLVMDITLSMVAYNYNQPISIVLPSEAEEAPDVTQQQVDEAETELSNIQTAVVALMVDNELSTLPNPVTIATNDMGAFPDLSICGIDKLYDPYGNPYITGRDKGGYLLFGHDITGDADKYNILVNYITSRYIMGNYTVDMYGTVTQVTTGYE